MSDFIYRHVADDDGPTYGVNHADDPGTRIGQVWRVDREPGSGSRWDAILAATGERAGETFVTREKAAEWLWGRYSVQFGAAAKFVPEDPFEGLPGA